MSGEPRYWFRAKRYGWGWGLPATWQGWLVLATYALLISLGAACVSPAARPELFVAYLVAVTVLLIAVCWIKGEPPRWRWGGRDDS